MKILIVVSSLNTGGAQRVAANLSVGLEGRCEVDFLLNESKDISYTYKGKILDLGFGEESNRLRLGYQARVFFRRLSALRKLKKTKQYDAVCSFLDSANIANILTGKRYCKTIISVHGVLSGYKVMKEYRYIVLPLVRLLYNHASKIVAVSQSVRNDLISNLGLRGDNIVTVYNGFVIDDILNRSQIDLPREDESIFENHIVIVAMGRLDWSKGFGHLIRIMPLLCKSIPDCRLLILGDGEDRELLQSMIDELDLCEKVTLAGFRDNPFCILKHADVFVLSSLDEALPSVLIEALILSVPCVSTDLPGTREIMAPGWDTGDTLVDDFKEVDYGIITPLLKERTIGIHEELTKEETLLAQAIVYILGNAEVKDKFIRLSQDVIDRFKVERMTEEWLSLIKQ